MSSPDISVNNLSSLSAVNLVEKLRSGTGDQLKNEGSIRIGSETYKVTYVPGENGTSKLQMKRNYTGFLIGSFLNWVHRNDLTTQPHAVELTNKANDMMKTAEYKLVRNTYDKLMDIAKGSTGDENGVIEVGNYGHSEPRKKILELGVVDAVNRSLQTQRTGKSIRLNKIDTYNTFLGITTSNMLPEKYGDLMWRIAHNRLMPDVTAMNSKDGQKYTVEMADLQKWREFISKPEIAAKIDIPKKLYGYLHQSEGQGDDGNQVGWKKDFKLNPKNALRHFVIKNLPANFMQTGLFDDKMIDFLCDQLGKYVEAYNEPDRTKKEALMKDFFNPYNWLLSDKEKAAIDKKIDDDLVEKAEQQKKDVDHVRSKYGEQFKANWVKKHGANALFENSKSYILFTNILTYSTFRQTSKLGLDFFKSQNKPLLFHMSNRDLTDFGNPEWILTERHWKNGQLDPTYGGSEITHSEVRHADKLVQRYGNAANLWYVQGA